MLLSIVFSFLTIGNSPPTAPENHWPVYSCAQHADCMAPLADDYSHAAPDGPHVFYRNGQAQVKCVVRRDSATVAASVKNYNSNDMPPLTCTVEPGGDRFSFRLRPNLRVEPDEYPAPSKLLAISDIEGNFEAFKLLLQGGGVIDSTFKWTFGNGHLVLVGDFFDRGLNVTEVLWLVYKLEAEAEAAGGKVHFILGNHEILNLEGNTQYVRNKYLENAELIGEPYPSWFGPNTELGRWLRTKNAIEKIGDVVFCHGGISEELRESGLTLRQVNETARQFIGTPFSAIEDAMAEKVFDTKTGIFWFRGMAKKQVSDEAVTRALEWAGAKRVVLGHTLMPDVTAVYRGRVICIDLYHDENLRQGYLKTLWMEGNSFFGITDKGEKSTIFNVAFVK